MMEVFSLHREMTGEEGEQCRVRYSLTEDSCGPERCCYRDGGACREGAAAGRPGKARAGRPEGASTMRSIVDCGRSLGHAGSVSL